MADTLEQKVVGWNLGWAENFSLVKFQNSAHFRCNSELLPF